MGYENFVEPMVPVLMKFRFWHVENPDEIKNGSLPKLTEKGPYVYEETRIKENITFQDDDQFINYGLYKQWDYRADLSCKGCSEDDEVTILNMPLIGAIALAQEKGLEKAVLGAVNKVMKGEHVYGVEDGCCVDDIFMTKGVSELLFGGIRDGLVRFLMESSLTSGFLPPQINKDGNGFAVMNPRNGTQDNEWYQVETGKVDWDRHAMIQMWGPQPDDMHENLEDTKWWPKPGYKGREDSCTKLEGTDGQQFPPFINKEKKWSFQTDICRSMSFVFEKEVDVEGIKAYRFTTSSESQWMNRTDNFCFNDELGELYLGNGTTNVYDACIKETSDPEVLDIKDCNITIPGAKGVDGIQDLHHCFKSPLYVTQPHFYQAETELANIAEGSMNPDPDLHGLQIDVEPNTGFSIRLHKRIQFNMPMLKDNRIDALKNVTDVVFPVLWIDEGADIDEENIEMFKSKLVTPILIVDVAKWTAIGLGALMTIGGVFLVL